MERAFSILLSSHVSFTRADAEVRESTFEVAPVLCDDVELCAEDATLLDEAVELDALVRVGADGRVRDGTTLLLAESGFIFGVAAAGRTAFTVDNVDAAAASAAREADGASLFVALLLGAVEEGARLPLTATFAGMSGDLAPKRAMEELAVRMKAAARSCTSQSSFYERGVLVLRT